MVWFPTTLEGEAYEWYRDHVEGHSRGWKQLQREFLNEFRPEVDQNTALRALSSLKQGREEEISAYIRRFDLVCTRFVGTMLNDDTLKQFFIQGFFQSGTIKDVLERNPQTLADAKRAAREMKNLDRDHERLWRREDEQIPQFIPIPPRVVEGETGKYGSQAPYALIDAGPCPLVVREPAPLLALPAPRMGPHLEEVEKRLDACEAKPPTLKRPSPGEGIVITFIFILVYLSSVIHPHDITHTLGYTNLFHIMSTNVDKRFLYWTISTSSINFPHNSTPNYMDG